MSDQPDATGDPRQAQIRVVVNDDQKHGTYANFLVVTHGPHEFTLDFCQLLPSGEQGVVNADVTARVRIAPTMVGQILRALNTNLSNYEEKFGDVKAVG
jgi:hypothetical protein